MSLRLACVLSQPGLQFFVCNNNNKKFRGGKIEVSSDMLIPQLVRGRYDMETVIKVGSVFSRKRCASSFY